MGLKVKHEVKDEDGYVDWHEMPDIGFHAADPNNLVRIVMRNPIDIMGSAFTLMNSSWDYMSDYVKVKRDKSRSKVQWTMEFLIQWYSICLEEHSHLLVATEKIKFKSKFFHDVKEFMDLPDITTFNLSNKINTRSNRESYRNFVIDELRDSVPEELFSDFKDLAEIHQNLLNVN